MKVIITNDNIINDIICTSKLDELPDGLQYKYPVIIKKQEQKEVDIYEDCPLIIRNGNGPSAFRFFRIKNLSHISLFGCSYHDILHRTSNVKIIKENQHCFITIAQNEQYVIRCKSEDLL